MAAPTDVSNFSTSLDSGTAVLHSARGKGACAVVDSFTLDQLGCCGHAKLFRLWARTKIAKVYTSNNLAAGIADTDAPSKHGRARGE